MSPDEVNTSSKRSERCPWLSVPLCNGRSESILQIGAVTLPIFCARCWGIVFGVIAGGLGISKLLPVFLSVLLILPCIFDGWNSYFGVGTTNKFRLVTGFLAGVGMMAAYQVFIKMLF